MTSSIGSQSGTLRPLLARSAGFFLLWLVLAGTGAKDLIPGIIAAVISAKVSLSLLPAHAVNIRPMAAASLFLRFLRQSVGAGLYVARCALDPRVSLKPGFVVHRSRFAAGPRRDAFATLSSLLPGTLPSGPDGSDGIIVHCLDTRVPVTEQLADEEQRFKRALKGEA